jgi:hypothetical protein
MHPRITMCRTALDPASIGRASVLPCVTRLQTMPSCSGGLRCCHVPHSSGLRLPAGGGGGGGGSDSATCHMAPDPASLLGRAPVLPRAPRL